MGAPTARATPFYCPYCADEDLRMHDPADGSAGHGRWRCDSCRRVFALKYIGLSGGSNAAAPQSTTSASAAQPSTGVTR